LQQAPFLAVWLAERIHAFRIHRGVMAAAASLAWYQTLFTVFETAAAGHQHGTTIVTFLMVFPQRAQNKVKLVLLPQAMG
jgi:lipid-binding SYLF domain-containing protein